jgi:hypothetical protein
MKTKHIQVDGPIIWLCHIPGITSLDLSLGGTCQHMCSQLEMYGLEYGSCVVRLVTILTLNVCKLQVTF